VQGWPARIDNPLPYEAGIDAVERLHDAIKHLNRSLRRSLLHFGGDGKGLGVFWREEPFPLQDES
jgi:hypothetical protein